MPEEEQMEDVVFNLENYTSEDVQKLYAWAKWAIERITTMTELLQAYQEAESELALETLPLKDRLDYFASQFNLLAGRVNLPVGWVVVVPDDLTPGKVGISFGGDSRVVAQLRALMEKAQASQAASGSKLILPG